MDEQKLRALHEEFGHAKFMRTMEERAAMTQAIGIAAVVMPEDTIQHIDESLVLLESVPGAVDEDLRIADALGAEDVSTYMRRVRAECVARLARRN